MLVRNFRDRGDSELKNGLLGISRVLARCLLAVQICQLSDRPGGAVPQAQSREARQVFAFLFLDKNFFAQAQTIGF